MVERIQELIKVLGISPSQFADEIGVQRSAISHLISGRNNPSLEFVLKILKRYPLVDTTWLMNGTGNMMKGTESESPVTPVTIPGSHIEPELFPELESADYTREEPVIVKKSPQPSPVPAQKATASGKKIEKIIIVYNDHTFRELNPEKD